MKKWYFPNLDLFRYSYAGNDDIITTRFIEDDTDAGKPLVMPAYYNPTIERDGRIFVPGSGSAGSLVYYSTSYYTGFIPTVNGYVPPEGFTEGDEVYADFSVAAYDGLGYTYSVSRMMFNLSQGH